MSDEGEEYEPDFDLYSEDPYSCCSVRCIICERRRARYTVCRKSQKSQIKKQLKDNLYIHIIMPPN